ncbi:hypothetical protein [Rhodovastum atsumiense]|uniref:Uncharacterized protein n=1 Tax=Rhodovastum atsumiense TaxID=504468 RepID=A0A5M6IYL9_9PROT|nr:hypothetical protein [Rhodovastum atsumiense]KAA5613440.1 hypothetical protein F1189_05120 [Rhodovastum atsumiense]
MALLVLPALAWAKGAGTYSVHGTNSHDQSSYDGTVTVTQAGDGTWRVRQKIAGESFDGYAIGDGNILAVTYSASGSTYIAVYVARDDGGYDGFWAEKGDKKVSTETWAPGKGQ